ncbi:hypothetical protein M3Y99_01555800 [Aphelenchoides fujianensis]|nr:hypothetical protein M3Y99_01555800 [Aphelenchoides fujianensis]
MDLSENPVGERFLAALIHGLEPGQEQMASKSADSSVPQDPFASRAMEFVSQHPEAARELARIYWTAKTVSKVNGETSDEPASKSRKGDDEWSFGDLVVDEELMKKEVRTDEVAKKEEPKDDLDDERQRKLLPAVIPVTGLVAFKNDEHFAFTCEPLGFEPKEVRVTRWRGLLVVEARQRIPDHWSSVEWTARFECQLPSAIKRRAFKAVWVDGRVVLTAQPQEVPPDAGGGWEIPMEIDDPQDSHR